MSVEQSTHENRSKLHGTRRAGVIAVGRIPRRAHPLAALAFAFALGACTSTAANPTTPTAPDGAETTSGAAPPDSTSGPSNQQQLAALWEALHTERLEQLHADGEPDAAPFGQYVTGDAAEAVLDYIRAGRADIAVDLVEVEHWTDIDIAPTATAAELADCLIVAERPANDQQAEATARSRVWTATATKTDDGWKLDSLMLGPEDCVPPELNAQLIDAYIAYHEAWTAAWDPPDPDHPGLEQIMTGRRLTEIREQLRDDQAAGIAFRDPHDPAENAVVFHLAIGSATVSDCHRADPGYGAFDVETGQRLDDVIAPVEPGQLNLTSTDLVRQEDGGWKVVESGGLDQANCEPGETDYVVAP